MELIFNTLTSYKWSFYSSSLTYMLELVSDCSLTYMLESFCILHCDNVAEHCYEADICNV